MKTALRLLLLIAVVAAAAGIVQGNRDAVSVDLVFGTFPLMTWQLILIPLGIGFALSAALFAWPMLRLRLRLRRLQARVGTLEQEVHGLRTLPLGDVEAAPTAAASVTAGSSGRRAS